MFVPFLIIDPQAQIPVVMLSLQRDLDPAVHISVGKALAPLRDKEIAIVGSGMSYHDLRRFRDGDGRASQVFDAWLDETLTKSDPATRERRLIHWSEAPAARACHPREEHLLPLMVVVGAADGAAGAQLPRGDRRQVDLGLPLRLEAGSQSSARTWIILGGGVRMRSG